jgi:hypothetical protein
MLPDAGTYNLDPLDNVGYWWEVAEDGELIFSDVPKGDTPDWYYGFELAPVILTEFEYAGDNPDYEDVLGWLITYDPAHVYVSFTGMRGARRTA